MPLDDGDIQKYKKLFLETARNYLKDMQACISMLLKNDQVHATVKQVHLDAHSLKSQSQLMGFAHIAKISEIVEHLFNKEEKDGVHVKHHVLIMIQSDITRLFDSLDQIEREGKEIDLTDRISELEKAKNG
jgi:chemotaxis protein histidine kinase CheA